MASPTERFTDRTLSDPLEDGIILDRDEHGVLTNVPHLVTHHSPDGFEFGYGGSGPADLALNICEAVLRHIGYNGERTECFEGTCFRAAFAMHQDFKWECIAGAPREGGTLSFEKVEAWIRVRLAGIEPRVLPGALLETA